MCIRVASHAYVHIGSISDRVEARNVGVTIDL